MPTITRDAAHRYFDGSAGPYPSATTVIKAAMANEALTGYVRRATIDFVFAAILNGPVPKGATRDNAAEWRDILETEATRAAAADADFGTAVHEDIERFIKLGVGPNEMLAGAQRMSAFRQFLRFEQEHGVRWLASEWMFVEPDEGYGGTVDGVGIVDETITVVDFKSGPRTWLEHVLQLAAYRHALIACSEDFNELRGAGVLYIPPGQPYRWLPIELTEWDYEIFLGQLEQYRWAEARRKELNIQ